VLVTSLFYAFSLVLLAAALGVITLKNPVHSALCLVLTFFTAAGIWLLVQAEFLAIVLVLVYVGAVMVLFLFGIMLTRARLGGEQGLNNPGWMLGIPVAVVLFGLLAYVSIDAFDDTTLPEPAGPTPTSALSDLFLSPYLIPFIALSFVLLAAAIGAIVLARKD